MIRSGNADPSVGLGRWIWLVPVYLYQRSRALSGPNFYVWAWVVSFVASMVVGAGSITALFDGSTYYGTGVPACAPCS